MKCFNHPNSDAVGACLKCGRGVCSECAKVIGGKIICRECFSQQKAVEPLEFKKSLIIAFLGWLGSVNVTFIGAYAALKLYHLGIMRGYQMEVYVVSGLTATLAFILVFGGYLILRGRIRRGGIVNFIAGIASLLMCIYFTWFVPLLREFGPTGLLLCLPALVSGIIGYAFLDFIKK